VAVFAEPGAVALCTVPDGPILMCGPPLRLAALCCQRRNGYLGVFTLTLDAVPGLTEGRHTIDVEQNIAAPHASTDPAVPVQNLTLTTHQEFEVYGPRYSLPANTVHQTYPPQGHADYGNILPHIVFEDPHLPWENEVTSKDASPFSTPPVRTPLLSGARRWD
jgi:hypothetical protein